MDRLTYRSPLGDYGSNIDYRDDEKDDYDPYKEVYVLRNRLGMYEDLGYSPKKLAEIVRLYEVSQFKY